MQKDIKNPFLSKQNWLNFITFIIGILGLAESGKVIPVGLTPYVVPVVAALNLVIRNFFTSKPTTDFAFQRNT